MVCVCVWWHVAACGGVFAVCGEVGSAEWTSVALHGAGTPAVVVAWSFSLPVCLFASQLVGVSRTSRKIMHVHAHIHRQPLGFPDLACLCAFVQAIPVERPTCSARGCSRGRCSTCASPRHAATKSWCWGTSRRTKRCGKRGGSCRHVLVCMELAGQAWAMHAPAHRTCYCMCHCVCARVRACECVHCKTAPVVHIRSSMLTGAVVSMLLHRRYRRWVTALEPFFRAGMQLSHFFGHMHHDEWMTVRSCGGASSTDALSNPMADNVRTASTPRLTTPALHLASRTPRLPTPASHLASQTRRGSAPITCGAFEPAAGCEGHTYHALLNSSTPGEAACRQACQAQGAAGCCWHRPVPVGNDDSCEWMVGGSVAHTSGQYHHHHLADALVSVGCLRPARMLRKLLTALR